MISRREFVRAVGIGAAGAGLAWPVSSSTEALALDLGNAGPIRLDNNENAYGPTRKVREAMRAALGNANRYPFDDGQDLAAHLAAMHRVKPQQVILGAGSTEVLRLAAAAFLGSGKQLVQASPTYETLGFYATAYGANVISVPLTRDYAHDLEGMLARAADAVPSLIYICNPNNPTGSLTPRADIETFLGKLPKSSFVLIDEAYHHYAGKSAFYRSFLDSPVDDPRVIVTRTFSKIYGLAGLRVGYGVGHEETIAKLRPYVTQTGVNQIALAAALAALADVSGTEEAIRRNADDRQEFFNQAIARMLRPIDSQTNFVMINTFHPAAEVIAHFQRNGILIGRRFPPLDTYIRVSLGTPPEMRAFWRAWDMLPFAKAPMHH